MIIIIIVVVVGIYFPINVYGCRKDTFAKQTVLDIRYTISELALYVTCYKNGNVTLLLKHILFGPLLF